MRPVTVWLGHSSGVFSTASAWCLLRLRGVAVPWSRFIWSPSLPPRYQTHLWLISRNRLPTQVLLLAHERIPNVTCAFCSSIPDSVDHLFFGCSITNLLASFWAAKCNLPWRNLAWNDNLLWVIEHLSDASFHQSLARFAFGALCYLIWKVRNNIIFRNERLYIPALKDLLRKAVNDRALSFPNFPDNPRNRRLQLSWGIPPSIFD